MHQLNNIKTKNMDFGLMIKSIERKNFKNNDRFTKVRELTIKDCKNMTKEEINKYLDRKKE